MERTGNTRQEGKDGPETQGLTGPPSRTEEVPRLGTAMHPLCQRRDVQGGPSLSSYSATLMDFPAPVLINLSGHKPGKSVYLCLGTRTQVPHVPCMCFPLSLLCYQRSIFTGRKKIYMDNQPFHSLNFFSLL